jgi:hypothetical protein
VLVEARSLLLGKKSSLCREQQPTSLRQQKRELPLPKLRRHPILKMPRDKAAQPARLPPRSPRQSDMRYHSGQNQQKRSRWGGHTQLVTAAAGAGSGAQGAGGGSHGSAAKQQQAIAVSQLSDKLAAFRKDRGVDIGAGSGGKLSLKLFVPEQVEGQRERNWVGMLIGKEGINKRRFEQETGATLFLRGEGTTLRGGKKQAEDAEAMHVLLEADSQEALDRARVKVLEMFNPRRDSTALALFDEAQIVTAALEKTTDTEECAFCGKPGHHHSKCPKRRTTFTMSGVRCAACGSTGHTARDCKGDRSKVASLLPAGFGTTPSTLGDEEYAIFDAELKRRLG